MPNADKLSVSSRTGAATVRPLSWWLSLLMVTALAGQASLTLATVLIDPTTSRHRREGYSVSELQTLTAAFRHSLRAGNLTLEEFYTRSFPLIAWIDPGHGGHFTLLEGATATSISLADPTRGRLSIAPNTWRELWLQESTGIVLELE